MTDRNELRALVDHDALVGADAIIVLEGDGFARAERGAALYKEGWAQTVVLSGGLPETDFSIPAARMLPHILESGVPKDAIILEERSLNTREQAIEVLKIARSKGWSKMIIVASPEHQMRAFLTFVKAAEDARMKIHLYNAPVLRQCNVDDLASELAKIEEYQKKGDVASYNDGIAHLASRS